MRFKLKVIENECYLFGKLISIDRLENVANRFHSLWWLAKIHLNTKMKHAHTLELLCLSSESNSATECVGVMLENGTGCLPSDGPVPPSSPCEREKRLAA